MGLTFHQPKEGFEEGDNTDDPGHNAREGTLGQMSQHIGSGQNNRFDVRIQELVSKVQNPGGFLRKTCVLGLIFGGVLTFVLLRGHSCTNIHVIVAPELKFNFMTTLNYEMN